MYPDGNIVILENNPPLLEDSVVRQIMSTQNRQYTPIDFRYITERKKRVDNLNYRAPNHYCRTVFEIAVSLTSNDRALIRKASSILPGTGESDRLDNTLERIIVFPEDRTLFIRIRMTELHKIIELADTGDLC